MLKALYYYEDYAGGIHAREVTINQVSELEGIVKDEHIHLVAVVDSDNLHVIEHIESDVYTRYAYHIIDPATGEVSELAFETAICWLFEDTCACAGHCDKCPTFIGYNESCSK